MNITPIQHSPAFQAKYLHSEALKQVADYAVEHGKFDKLNQSRKNIDKSALQTRLRFDLGENDGRPFVSFKRYKIKPTSIIVESMDYLVIDKVSIYRSCKKMNPLKFALEQLIKIGNDAPKNNMFKNVILKK